MPAESTTLMRGALSADDLELGSLSRKQSGFDSSRSSLDEERSCRQCCDVQVHDEGSLEGPEAVVLPESYRVPSFESLGVSKDSPGLLRERLKVGG